MADVTPIRPNVSPDRVMNDALLEQQIVLFQAMGIVKLASHAIQSPRDTRAHTDAWTALDGAYELLCSIADRLGSVEQMLAEERPERGDY